MRWQVFLILALCLFVQVIVYAGMGHITDYNTVLWHETGKIADEHGLLEVYEKEGQMLDTFEFGYFAFPPPWLIICYISYKIAENASLDIDGFAYIIRLLPLLALGVSTLLVFVYMRKGYGDVTAATGSFIYAVALGVVNWFALYPHGQIDAIPVCLTILALIFAREGRIKEAILSLGIGAAFKLYPLVLILGLMVKEWGRGARISDLFRYSILGTSPLILFSLPYIVHNAGAYFGALTQYSAWVGPAALYVWIYALEGVPLYLWRGTVPANAPVGLIPIVTFFSLLITLIALLVSYIKIREKKGIGLLRTIQLPLLSLLAYWKFIDASFVTWAFPFAVIEALGSSRLWSGIVYLFVLFYISLMVFDGVNYLPLTFVQLAAIIYHLDLLRQ
ncbi:hypothetical protein DRN67_03825 [Candidatus Micrarchaeota archaeon]|nr:MAG: hypothetical protein DRN67_03825 [Candidatus Micrarchaeota archaeon]